VKINLWLFQEDTMQKKQEKELQKLADQALRLAWRIAEKKDAPCGDLPPPPLEVARYESIVAFRATAMTLIAIFKL
jgi:hypothetical protein